jgi:hypothetical protein
MWLGKQSRNVKTCEKLKKQHIGSSADASGGSSYAPSEGEVDSYSELDHDMSLDTIRKKKIQPDTASEEVQGVLHALVELEAHDLSDLESDGEIMLGDGDVLDENDWDPEFLPDIYPIFTQSVSNENIIYSITSRW